MIKCLLLSIFVGGHFSTPSKPDQKLDCYQIIDKVTDQTESILKKRYKLRAIGVGGGITGREQNLALELEYDQFVKQDQARYLIVSAAEEYLKQLNAHTELENCKFKFPFTMNNLDMAVCFHQQPAYFAPPGELTWVSLDNNILRYSVRRGEYETECVLQETFDEAKEKLKTYDPKASTNR